MTDQGWIVYGCRTPYALEVAEIVWRREERIAFLVDNLDDPSGEATECSAGMIDAPVVLPGDLTPGVAPVVVPLITPGHRYTVEAELRQLGFSEFPALIDPTAVVARTASIGEGSVVNASATVGAATTVGRFVHINRSASIGHHGTLADFATLGPACVLAGHVEVGKGAFVGAGAVCAPGVTLGANSLVGAGAVVVADVPPRAVVAGNPARVIRTNAAGYGNASVPG